MTNIATLGLEFSTKGAENKIEKLCKAFDELSKKSDSIETVFKSLSTFKPLNDTFITQIASLSKSFSTLKGISPEITESVKTFFASFESIKTVDAAAIDSVAKLGVASSQFKVINPGVATSVDKLFSSIGNNLPNIDAQKIDSIAKLGTATSQFKAIRPNVATSVEQLFRTITNVGNIKYNTIDTVARLGEGLSKFKAIKPGVADSVKNLFDTLNRLQPISATLRISIKMLTDMFNAMAAAGRNASGATKTLGNSMGYAQTQTDGLSIAFRTLQGAVSFNFFKSAAAQAVEFGTELAYIQSIASELDVSQIGTGVMNMSSVLGNASESLKGLYYAYSSGIRGSEEDFLKFTETMRKTAIVNRSSFIPTINAATAAMNAYNISVDRAEEVADTFFAIVKYGKASGEQLANSLGQVTPTAKTLGVSLDELGASIASLTKIQPTRVAITGLNNMLSKIMKPTKESRLALQKLGVDMSYSAVQSKGFVKVLEEVREVLNGDAEAIKNIFPDIRGQRAAMHLLGAGWKDFNEQLKNFENKKGSMEDAFETVRKNTAVQLGALPETIKKIVTEAGDMITKFVTLGGVLTPIIAAFNNMSEGARKFFAAVTLVVGGYAAYKAAMFALQSLHAIQLKNEAALAAAQTAKLAQLREEVALRTHLAAVSNANAFSPGNTIRGVGSTRLGFDKGFAAMFKPIRMANMSLKRFSIILKGTFAKALTYAGAILGKVATVITTVFSAANMIIGGLVAIAAVGIDYAINGVEKSLTTDAIEGIYNWWTGAADKAKAMDEYIQRTRTNLQAVRDAKDEFENFQRSVYEWYKSALVGESESKKAQTATLKVYDLIDEIKENITARDFAIAEQEKLTQKEIELGRKEEDARKNQLSTAQKVWEYINLSNPLETIRSAKNLIKAWNNDKKLAEITKKREETTKHLADASSNVSKYSELSTKNLQDLKRSFDEQRKLLESQIENLKAMKSIFDAQAYKEASPDMQISISQKQFAEQIKAFKDNITQGNTEVAKKSLQAAQNNYNTIRDNAIKIGEDMAKLQMEGMLIGASDSKKYAIYSNESTKALSDVKSAIAAGQYNAAAKSLKSYVSNTQKAVAIQQKLANAEKQANDKTLQMILALDKFKVTAMDFIDVNSTEAMKLQSRSFGSLPQFTPLTAQQNAAQNANDKLVTAIGEYTAKITELANKEKNTAESNWQKVQLDNEKRISELQEKAADELTKTRQYFESVFQELIKRGQEQDKTQEEEYRKKSLEIEEANQKRLEEIKQQIQRMMQSGIAITNLKIQKVLG